MMHGSSPRRGGWGHPIAGLALDDARADGSFLATVGALAGRPIGTSTPPARTRPEDAAGMGLRRARTAKPISARKGKAGCTRSCTDPRWVSPVTIAGDGRT